MLRTVWVDPHPSGPSSLGRRPWGRLREKITFLSLTVSHPHFVRLEERRFSLSLFFYVERKWWWMKFYKEKGHGIHHLEGRGCSKRHNCRKMAYKWLCIFLYSLCIWYQNDLYCLIHSSNFSRIHFKLIWVDMILNWKHFQWHKACNKRVFNNDSIHFL